MINVLLFWILIFTFLIIDIIFNGTKNGGDNLWLNYFLGNLRNNHPYNYIKTNSE
jgi:hypothetical protein